MLDHDAKHGNSIVCYQWLVKEGDKIFLKLNKSYEATVLNVKDTPAMRSNKSFCMSSGYFLSM